MKILVAGGGTGGHFYPALAIMEGLRQHPQLKIEEIAYIGTKRGIEARILAQPQHHWIRFFPIRARGLDREHIGRLLLALLEMPIGLFQSLCFIRQFKPDVIIGVGGYAAFSSLFWGILLGIPTLIHEQNSKPGLVNKLLGRWVNKICLTYSKTERYFAQLPKEKIAVTGLPVRPTLVNAQPNYEQFGLKREHPTIFVVGGSRGSEFLTKTVMEAYSQIRPQEAQVILVTGSHSALPNTYKQDSDARIVLLPYLEEMGAAFAVADLVICRAGATTLAELAAVGKPAILVPWPGAAENHQYENARVLAESGGLYFNPRIGFGCEKARRNHQSITE